jgi:hypothetical protein
MTITEIESKLGLDESIPDKVWILFHPRSGKYGCYNHQGIHGLACFSNENSSFRFAEFIDLVGMVSKEVSFDEAREVAKSRPLPVIALMLCDDMDNPNIHYIR